MRRMSERRTLMITALTVFVLCVMTMGASTAFGEEQSLGTLEKPEQTQIEKKEYIEGEALVMFRTPDKLTGTKGKNKTKSLFKEDVSDISIEGLWMFSSPGELTTSKKGGKKLIKDPAQTGYNGVALVRSKRLSTKQLIKILKARDDVKYAEPNYKVHARGVSNDTYSDYQWSMQDVDSAPKVTYEWVTRGTSGSENIVAILDTGVDYTHPDLAGNIWENDHWPVLKGDCGYDFINGDTDPMDDNGHGTHCAGIIGAVGDNGKGISGVNKKIKIMPLKTLDKNGQASMAHEVSAYNYIDIALDAGEPIKAINNSWGDGEYSEIFAELVDIVGEKGAVTVCAAGNKASNNDIEGDYPSCIDSPYLISVAATDRKGNLAEFSNYGRESVDVAAPGAEILSTVPYDSYNPTIYKDPMSVSERYNDFSGSDDWGLPDQFDPEKGKIYINGELYEARGDQPEITVEKADEGFENKGSMAIDIKNSKEQDLICITVPYEISKTARIDPTFSLVARASGPDGATDLLGGPIFGMTEMASGTGKGISEMGGMSLIGTYIDGETSIWDHFEMECPMLEDIEDLIAADDDEARKRDIVLLVYAYKAGDYSIRIDDMGMSRQDLDSTEVFGKYDYMSGTSMAAPYISGAVALKAAELRKTDPGVDPETIINETISMAKKSPVMEISQRGAFDFSQRPENLPPRIGKITVDQARNEIIIRGSGLDQGGDLKVEIGPDDRSLETVSVKSKSDRSIVVADRGWINNLETIRITGRNDRESIRHDVYMVNGKKAFSSLGDAMGDPGRAMTTDGGNIYWSNTLTGELGMKTISNGQVVSMPLCMVEPEKLFSQGSRKTGDYGMLFGDDLVYTGGKLYTIVEYGLIQATEGGDTGWRQLAGIGKANLGEEFYLRGSMSGGEQGTIYSGEMRLITTYMNEDEEYCVANLGGLPSDLRQTVDWTMTTYGGNLYFIGGYSMAKGAKGFSKKVKIYDPATRKWSDGPALPEGRAGGEAIQSGDKLIYTMGYSAAQNGKAVEEQTYPQNLIFDGRKWSSSKAKSVLEPLVINHTVTRNGQEYITSEGRIGITKGGIVYTGNPVANFGDTFIYDAGKDQFIDTGYNFIRKIDSEEINGIAVGGSLYGFVAGKAYRIPIASGLISVNANKAKGGSVSGAGAYLPGETAKPAVRSATKFKIKALKVNGKKVKLKKNQRNANFTFANLSADQQITATFVQYKAKIKIKKKGKGKVTGGKTYLIGKKATIKVKAAKGHYIKSIKVGKKKIKVKKRQRSKTFKFKVKKDATVKVVFKKR